MGFSRFKHLPRCRMSHLLGVGLTLVLSSGNLQRAHAELALPTTRAESAAAVASAARSVDETRREVSSHLDGTATGCRIGAAAAEILGSLRAEGRSEESPLALGARRAMVATYQDCSVLSRPPFDPILDSSVQGLVQEGSTGPRRVTNTQALIQSHYYLRTAPNPVPSGCVNPLAPPQIYAMGAKPNEYTYRSTGKIDLFSNLSVSGVCARNGYECGAPAARGVDCSGFLSSALAAAGLRSNTGSRFASFGGTSNFVSEIENPETSSSSCFSRVSARSSGGTEALKSGDVFVVPGNHVLIIDSAGKDPFGINRVESCGDISPEYFDFRVIQSSATGNGIGVNRMEASTLFGVLQARVLSPSTPPAQSAESMGFLGPLLRYAQEACASVKSSSETTRDSRSSSTGRVMRHKGTTACRATPASFDPADSNRGLDCTRSCDLHQMGAPTRLREVPGLEMSASPHEAAHVQ